MSCIRYADGYKYQLRATYAVQLPFRPPAPIVTDFIVFDADGLLTIIKGYAWDGPSDPAFDTPNFMRGSLVHDALYQLMRERHLDATYRGPADDILRTICLEDGMWRIRAWWVHLGVRIGGGPAADPALVSPDKFAPAGCCSPMTDASQVSLI